MTINEQSSIGAVDPRVGEFIARCRATRLKVTPQRIEIYKELAGTDEHPDAETIFRRVRNRIPAISFNTVYQTLRALQERGLIARVAMPFDRARFDARTTRHHHFICTQCGAIRDFVCPDYEGLSPPQQVRAFGVPQAISVEVRGVCHACGAAAAPRRRRRCRDVAAAAEGGETEGNAERRPAGGAHERRRSTVKNHAEA